MATCFLAKLYGPEIIIDEDRSLNPVPKERLSGGCSAWLLLLGKEVRLSSSSLERGREHSTKEKKNARVLPGEEEIVVRKKKSRLEWTFHRIFSPEKQASPESTAMTAAWSMHAAGGDTVKKVCTSTVICPPSFRKENSIRTPNLQFDKEASASRICRVNFDTLFFCSVLVIIKAFIHYTILLRSHSLHFFFTDSSECRGDLYENRLKEDKKIQFGASFWTGTWFFLPTEISLPRANRITTSQIPSLSAPAAGHYFLRPTEKRLPSLSQK